MIDIYCTQKLQVKLPVDKHGLLPDGQALTDSLTEQIINNPLSGWHANLLTIQRRNCILMVHNQTRFPLLLTGLTKKDFAALDYLFADVLMNTLLKVGADEEQMQAAETLLAALSINKAYDRSVQGTLNQMSGDIEHSLWHNNVNIIDCSAYRMAAWLADRPCSVKSREIGAAKSKKDTIWPAEAMLNLLDSHELIENEF